MVRETLDRLADDLNHWLAAGTAALPVEGVQRHLAALRTLVRRIPALARLADTLESLQTAEPARRAALLLDLLLLVRQGQDALSTAGADGPCEELPASGPWVTPLPAGQAADAQAALCWKGKGRIRHILNASEVSRGADLRLFGPLFDLLDHRRRDVAEAAEKALPAF